MTTYRRKRPVPYTQVANRALRDNRLSFRARGVLCWILSHVDDWRVRADQIADAGPEGRDAIRKALNELRSAGYLVQTKRQNDRGQWVTETVVNEFPGDAPESGNQASVLSPPGPENPTPANPDPGGPGAIRRTHVEEHVEDHSSSVAVGDAMGNEPRLLAIEGDEVALARRSSRPRDEVWDALLLVCGISPDGPFTRAERGKYNAAVKQLKEVGATAADVAERAALYRLQMPPQSAMTPSAIVANWSRLTPNAARQSLRPALTEADRFELRHALNEGDPNGSF